MFHDSSRQRGPATVTEWMAAGVLATIIFSFFVADIAENYTPIKLSALLVLLFWIPLLVTHECGHALAAYLLDWYVGQVVIGMGRVLGRFRAGTASVEIRAIPTQGFVRSVPKNLNQPQLRSALIYFAGPGMDLAFAGMVLMVIGPDKLFTIADDYGSIVWQSLALAAAAQGILNLLPMSVGTEQGDIASDGLGIIRSLMRPDRYYAAMIGQTFDERERD